MIAIFLALILLTALVRGSYLVKMLCSTEYPTDMYYRYMALWYHYLRGFGRCGLLLGLVGGLAYVNLMLAPARFELRYLP